jgi:hypothetical protein
MKYVFATICAILIFVGALAGILFFSFKIYPAIYDSTAGLVSMYVLGVPLAILAAYSSFRATVRTYSKK